MLRIRIALCLLLILCFSLSGCGAASDGEDTDSPAAAAGRTVSSADWDFSGVSESELPGMTHICLYCENDGRDFEHDLEIVRERVAAFTGGKYAIARTSMGVVSRTGEPSGEEYPAIELYLPGEVFQTRLPLDALRFLISRPVDLWIGENEGTGNDSEYPEKLPLRREDIASAEVLEGCPPGINPFDYGIDADTFSYLQVTLSDAFCEQNPQIRSWKRPAFLHDVENFDKYYHTEGVSAGDWKTIYLLGFSEIETGETFEEGRRYLEALAYDYTHEPLTQGFYVSDIPCAAWETPDPDSPANQIAPDAFTKPSIVFTYRLEEEICSDADWEAAIQTIKDRLETLGIEYAIGQADREIRTLLVRVEYSKAISDLMRYLIMENPDLSLSMCGKTIRIKGGEAGAAIVKEGDGYVLSLDLSANRKDLLNRLTSLSTNPEGNRLVLSIGTLLDAIPFLWTDCSEMIRDGKITLDHSAFSGETGFPEEDRAFLDFAAALLNGSLLPEAEGKQKVTLSEEDYAELDASGQFCMLDGIDLKIDYSGYYAALEKKAAKFSPVSSGRGVNSRYASPSSYIVQFDKPSEKTQTKEITDALARMIPAFEDDIFEVGMRFDWQEGENAIRISCISQYDAPGMICLNILGYGNVSQPELDALAESFRNDPFLRGRILVDMVLCG